MTLDIPTREDFARLEITCLALARRVETLERLSEAGRKRWLNTDEACALLSVSPRTLATWSTLRKITPHKVGRKNLYSATEIEKLLQQ